jgi:hypothetical protein
VVAPGSVESRDNAGGGGQRRRDHMRDRARLIRSHGTCLCSVFHVLTHDDLTRFDCTLPDTKFLFAARQPFVIPSS